MGVIVDERIRAGAGVRYMSESDAIAWLTLQNISVRVSARDGQSLILTRDYKPLRANLIVRKGCVVDVSWG